MDNEQYTTILARLSELQAGVDANGLAIERLLEDAGINTEEADENEQVLPEAADDTTIRRFVVAALLFALVAELAVIVFGWGR